MSDLLGRKIELLPIKLKNNQIHCKECKGIGWLDTEQGSIESCKNCGGKGYINLCESCGVEVNYYHSLCDECQRKKWNEKLLKEEQEAFERSEKLIFGKDDEKIKEIKQFYSEIYPYNEGFFDDFDEFFDVMKEKGFTKETGPLYVWATQGKLIELDVDNILEYACEELHENSYENISDEDYNELKTFLQQWCAKQTGTATSYPNYRCSIMVPWEDGK